MGVEVSALRMGMGNSYGLRCTVAANADFNPALPTAATMMVTKPSGEAVTWTASITSQSVSSITVRYVFNVNGQDLDEDGDWRVWIQWTVAGQTPGPQTDPGTFPVLAPNQL